ncbi:MAG: serine/threonine protein kinase, partial [Terriglobales bacterium]
IKLYPADSACADLQLSSWESAAQLSHPNLLRLHRSGRCRIDGNDLLYLVMEYAEEDLSQILPQRALTMEETRDMLGPVLDALQYLHGKGFIHGDLKPANILASGDHLKLSSDAISRIGEALSGLRRAGVYDPPEAISGPGKPAGDVWSLGTALVEILTQKLPEWQPGPHREPVVPANIPSPFQEIARECLRLEPERRISIAEIGARLNPRSAAATASASSAAPVSSLGVSPAAGVAPKMPPLTPKVITAVPAPPRSVARVQSSPHRPPPYRESGGRPRFLVPLILVALLVAAIVTVPRLLTHRPEVQPAAQKPAQSAAVSKPKAASETEPKVSETTRPAAPAMAQANQKPAQPTAPESLKATSEKVQPPDRTPPPASSVATDSVKPASGGVGSSKGEVLDQVLPD